jgi:hypothetical protein
LGFRYVISCREIYCRVGTSSKQMKLQDIHLCLFVVHKQKTTIVGDTVLVCGYLYYANVDIYH